MSNASTDASANASSDAAANATATAATATAANASQTQEQIWEQALALIKQGCTIIAGLDGGSPEEKRLRPAIALLHEAATIVRTVPDAGENPTLRWRLYQAIQAQEGGDNAALYKELRCSIHLGLAGECSDPVTLPCGHSFCKTCVAPFYYSGVSASQRKCPQCRELITVPYSSLKPNVAINGVTSHLLPLGSQHDAGAIAAVEARVASATAATAAATAATAANSYYSGIGPDSFYNSTAYYR